MSRRIIIIGAGVSGLTASIALAKQLADSIPELRISLYDTRTEQPLGEGGAISLTPVAQHYLDELDVVHELRQMQGLGGMEVSAVDLFDLHSGKSLGSLQFADDKGAGYGCYRSRRVLRSSLTAAILAVARRYESITVHWGKKLVATTMSEESVMVQFADGTTASGDMLLGCDGVHSVVRTQLVDPGNLSDYTGLAFVQCLAPADRIQGPVHFQQTAFHLTRRGSLLLSYCDEGKERLFAAGIMSVSYKMVKGYQEAALVKEERTINSYQSALRSQIREAFGKSAFPCIQQLIDRTKDWTLYPVYQIRQCSKKWHTNRVLLLGDSAHAMPPREESTAFCIEDSITFAQIFAFRHNSDQGNTTASLSAVFEDYEAARQDLIGKAFDASRKLWQHDLDSHRFPGSYRDLISPLRVLPTHAPQGLADARYGSSCPPTYESMSDLSVYALTRDHIRTEQTLRG
ncbi:putative monooxygenase [Aspergillus granulosus]|uniref:Monooxygenase n=1 Tax=Aspergillus granulosus TaxID=176169 RepID=A0ABR4H1Q5_9EURO